MSEPIDLISLPPAYPQSLRSNDGIESGASSARNSTAGILRTGESDLLPPVDTGKQAWAFCIASCALDITLWGFNNSFGVFQDYYTTNMPFGDVSSAAISTIGTTSLAIQYIETVFIILICQRYPERVKLFMRIALFSSVLALVLSSFATEVSYTALAPGVLYAPVVLWLSEWFVERRGLAGGIIFGGSGAGGFIFPIGLGYLLDRVGFRWTLRIWAFLFGSICAVALLWINPRVPARKPISGASRIPWVPKNFNMFKTSNVFPWLLFINFSQALGLYPVSLFISTYTSFLSTSFTSSTAVLALFNATSVMGQIGVGRLCDSFPYPYVIFMSGLGSALSAFLLWGFASNLGMVFAFAIVFGTVSGGFVGSWPAAATEVASTHNEQTSIALGWFGGVKGVAAILGPLIAGSLRDLTNNSKSSYGAFGFKKVEIFVGSMAVVTSLGAVALLSVSTAHRKTK